MNITGSIKAFLVVRVVAVNELATARFEGCFRTKVLVSSCMEMGVKLVLLVSAAGSALTRFRVSGSGKPIKV